MRKIDTDTAPAAIGPYSQAVVVDGWVYASGQLPLDPESNDIVGDDITSQTRQVLLNLENVLLAAGARPYTVIKTTVYLTNMDDFSAMNTAYAETFGDFQPARVCVEVRRLPKDVLVEIDAIARTGH